MDTRSKILDGAALAARITAWLASNQPVTLVEGTFDPLLAEHAAQVESRAAGGPVVAVIRDGAEPILDSSVRAELAAALRSVAAVLQPGDAVPVLPGLHRVSFVEQDEATARSFVAHVHSRNRAPEQE